MSMTTEELSTALLRQASATPADRPWYLGALLGASGWLAGAFLLGFVALLFHPDSAAPAAVAGAALLAAAWALFALDREGARTSHVFVAQLALALSIAGQCLILFAMTEPAHGIAPIASAALLLQVVLALLMRNRLHRTLSTVFATIAWALAVRFVLFEEPGAWHSARAAGASLVPSLAGWLLVWLPIGGLLWALIRREPAWMARGWQPWLRPIISGLIVGLAFATLASQPFESLRWFGGGRDALPQTNWIALWPLLSASGAIGGVIAAFALRSRALVGACVAAVLAHVGHFYYALGASLLLKSLLMLSMGAAMLLAARWLAKGERA